MWIRDPGWKKIRIRDPGWKKDGSGIPDKYPGPQHCKQARGFSSDVKVTENRLANSVTVVLLTQSRVHKIGTGV
jgi:hypothetical protein